MIDWWIMANIVVNIGIFGFHIFLDNWIKRRQLAVMAMGEDQVAVKSRIKCLSKYPRAPPTEREIKLAENQCPILKRGRRMNCQALTLTTVSFATFCLIYWTRALCHYFYKLEFDGGLLV